MKITVIGPTYPYKGGISHFTTVLAKTLQEKNEVNFLSWKRQYPSFLYPVELKDTKSKNPVKVTTNYLLDFYNPLSWLQAFQSIKKNNSDLLILTWASPIQAPIYYVIASFVKRFTRAKILFICHNVLPHEKTKYDLPLIKMAFKKGDIFIVHSKQDKNNLETIVSNKRIIPSFLPLFDMFADTPDDRVQEIKKKYELKKHVLLFFGYIRPYKGLMYLLKAMPEILKKYPDTILLVVGQFWSKDKEQYVEQVRELNIEKAVKFIDHYVQDEEVG